ncbi:MAG: hypothetical protein ABIQ51_05115 [Mesorhizobium sp.]
MSLPVLVAIVVFGIALSVAAVHFTGGSRTAKLANAEQARGRFADDFPDETVTSVLLTLDGRTAFLDLGQARTGIVSAVGDCFLTRIVEPSDITALSVEAATISFRLADFTWKGGRFIFADASDAKVVVTALEPQNSISAKEAA